MIITLTCENVAVHVDYRQSLRADHDKVSWRTRHVPSGCATTADGVNASSSASGGHAATATANTLNSGAAATLAHNDKQIPNTNDNHAAHRPPARRLSPVFHSSRPSPLSATRQRSAARWRPWCRPRRTAVRTPARAGKRRRPRRARPARCRRTAPTARGPAEPGMSWCSPQHTSRRAPHVVRAAADAGE